MDNMLQKQTVSPKTHLNHKIELEKWVNLEKESIKRTKSLIVQGDLTLDDAVKKVFFIIIYILYKILILCLD